MSKKIQVILNLENFRKTCQSFQRFRLLFQPFLYYFSYLQFKLNTTMFVLKSNIKDIPRYTNNNEKLYKSIDLEVLCTYIESVSSDFLF